MQEYEELKNEILDVIDERIASLRSELTSFKNEMIELFNRRTIDTISESRTALNNAVQKIDTTMADVEVKFNKANDDFKKASEILNLGEYNINAASLKSLFAEQSKASQSIENLKGDIIRVSTEQSNLDRNIEEKITNMSTKVKNDLRSEVTLDISKIKDEFRKTIEDKNIDLVRFAVQSAGTFTETKIREVRTTIPTEESIADKFTGIFASKVDVEADLNDVRSGITMQLGEYAKTSDVNQRFEEVESGFTVQLGSYATKDYVTTQVTSSSVELKNWATTGGIKVDNNGLIIENSGWVPIQTGTTVNP